MLRAFWLHPDDHGWHPFYEVLGRVMDAEAATLGARGSAPQDHAPLDRAPQHRAPQHRAPQDRAPQGRTPLARIVGTCRDARPSLSVAHFTTLLCIAIKSMKPDGWRDSRILDRSASLEARADELAAVVDEFEVQITDRVLTRQNAFSCARRYLVPQVIIARYAARAGLTGIRLIDLGTGAGVMPRQLNSRECYDQFAPDLTWALDGLPRVPQFQQIPLAERWGMDLPPVADLDWVRACYGPSEYYDERYDELLWALKRPEVTAVDLRTMELDLLDTAAVGRFLREHRFTVVTCSFVLYQYEEERRADIVRCVADSLPPGGMFLSMEPNGDLTRPGCLVRLYRPGEHRAIEFAEVSNGHFLGEVLPGRDFDRYRSEFL